MSMSKRTSEACGSNIPRSVFQVRPYSSTVARTASGAAAAAG